MGGLESGLMSLHTWLGGAGGEAGDMSGGCRLMLYTPGFRRGPRPLPATLLYLRLILSCIQLVSVFSFPWLFPCSEGVGSEILRFEERKNSVFFVLI